MAPHACTDLAAIYPDQTDEAHSYSFQAPKTALAPRAVEQIGVFPVKQTKAVTLKKTVAAKKTIHVNDYTDEEITSCWYTEEENETIKAQSLLEASDLLDTEVSDDIDYQKSCFRGLEHYVLHIAEERMAYKTIAVSTVLEEQQLQREEGSDDPEFIAELYAECTSLARVKASILGLNDRLEALH
jgi:hypothetical protein